MDTVVLLSGGVESTTLLHRECRRGACQGLFVDYGQRAAAPERRAAEIQCRAARVPLQTFDLGSLGAAFRRHQKHKLHVPVPHRNLLVLSLGLSLATQTGARQVALALNREDTGSYASAALGFVERFQALATTLGEVRLVTPLIGMTKAEVVREGLRLGVEFAGTYSCLLGYPQHCGRCPQCRKRRAAFAAAGVAEPAERYRA